MGSRGSRIGTGGSLLNDAGLLNHADVRGGAAIADRRFIGIHLHKSIVQAHPGESGKNMLDSVHLHIAFDDGGGALDGFDVFDSRLDDRIVRQVLAFELESVSDRSRVERERDFFTRMKGHPAETGRRGRVRCFSTV